MSYHHRHRTADKLSPGPSIQYGDKRYQPDEATIAIWEFLKTLPSWEKVARSDSYEGSGSGRHLLRSGATHLVRYIQFYHLRRSKYIARHPNQPFELRYIIKELALHIEHDYNIQAKESMAIVYSLLHSEIEKAARKDFRKDPSRFPLGAGIDRKFLLNLIDVAISYLGHPPYTIMNLGWAGVESIFYARALGGEDHIGFFAWPFSGDEEFSIFLAPLANLTPSTPSSRSICYCC